MRRLVRSPIQVKFTSCWHTSSLPATHNRNRLVSTPLLRPFSTNQKMRSNSFYSNFRGTYCLVLKIFLNPETGMIKKGFPLSERAVVRSLSVTHHRKNYRCKFAVKIWAPSVYPIFQENPWVFRIIFLAYRIDKFYIVNFLKPGKKK